MSANGYGRGGGYVGHGIDRARPVPSPPVAPPRGTFAPTRGGFDHPNIRVPPMSRDIPPPPSRAPYNEPIGNNSSRTYPDMSNLSLNDNRARSQDDDYQRQSNLRGPPAPPAGRYGDPDDAGPPRQAIPRDADDRDYRAPPPAPPTMNRTAFGNPPEIGRQPPPPVVNYNRGESDRSREPYPGHRPAEQNGPLPPPGYASRQLDPRMAPSGGPPPPAPPSSEPRGNDRDRPPASNAYNDRYAQPMGRYEDDRRPPPPMQYDREALPYNGNYNAPRGPPPPRNGYDAPPPRGGPYDDDRNGYDRRPAYNDRRPEYDDRYGYDDRRGPPPPSSRGYPGMDRPPMYNNRPPPSDYDNYRRPAGGYNDRGYDDRRPPPFNPPPPSRGGGGFGGYGRREPSPPGRGYGGFNGGRSNFARSGGNDVPLGGNRFANSGQNTRPQFDGPPRDNYRPSYGQKERAPRDYVPTARKVEDIFENDKKHTLHDGAFLSKDADIEVLGSPDLIQMNCERWEEMELHPKILQNIANSGYVYPRKIQQHTIPYVFEGHDIMCQGETGSGKTAAFLIPVIHKFLQDKESGAWKFSNRPYCLIISPTRELANQLYEQANKFANGTGVIVERAYGEINVRENIRQVARCDILIGCVGRLVHFMTGGELQCQDIKMLIIDEADRLFGDQQDQKFFEIFRWLPDRLKRQTLLFSATLQDRVIQALANDHMKPDCINIMAKNQSNSRVTYLIYAVESESKKMGMLVQYLRSITKNDKKPRCLVFVNQKAKTDHVAVELTTEGINATTIHGDRSQDLREEALRDFQAGKVQVLVATDVCARGVDIYDMDYVVNMDLPKDKSTYIQRCGRTGRLQEGYAVSFYYEPMDRLLGPDIAGILENSHQPSPDFLHNGVRPEDFGIREVIDREQRSNLSSPSNVSAASTSTAVAGSAAPAPVSASAPTSPPVIHDSSVAEGW